MSWLSTLLNRHTNDTPPVVCATPSPTVTWHDATPEDGFDAFFCRADETHALLAAVNRIAEHTERGTERDLMTQVLTQPLQTPCATLAVTTRENGFRFDRRAGARHRWVTFCSRKSVPCDFAIEFTYVPHAEFREQLQIDFATRSLGERLRFMVRNNEKLVFNRVEGGFFQPDDFTLPFHFELERPVRMRLESANGVHAIFAEGQPLLSVRTRTHRDGYLMLIFYEDNVQRDISFSLGSFKYYDTL